MTLYRKKGVTPMRPYVPGEDMTGITIGAEPPAKGGMVAHDIEDPNDLWYISKEFFDLNYEAIDDG